MINTIETKIQQQINDNPIIIYIKGTPKTPECGFSARAIQILSTYNKNYTYINILDNPDIRITLPKLSNWPTFPQLWVNGEFIGGCDIMVEMHNNGALHNLLHNIF